MYRAELAVTDKKNALKRRRGSRIGMYRKNGAI